MEIVVPSGFFDPKNLKLRWFEVGWGICGDVVALCGGLVAVYACFGLLRSCGWFSVRGCFVSA